MPGGWGWRSSWQRCPRVCPGREHKPPTCGWSQLFSGFSFQHCHLHISHYELIPNLLSEKDQTSPYVFVSCFLCLLLSRYPGFEVRLKGK